MMWGSEKIVSIGGAAGMMHNALRGYKSLPHATFKETQPLMPNQILNSPLYLALITPCYDVKQNDRSLVSYLKNTVGADFVWVCFGAP
jgi:hypothetical protein